MSVEILKTAAVQMNATEDKEKNCRKAERLFFDAVDKGADLVVFPECFVFRGRLDVRRLKDVSEPLSGPTVKRFQKLASDTQCRIVLGSIYEKASGRTKAYNTSVVINEDGEIDGVYRKRNLFAAKIKGKKICEADIFLPGRRFKTFSVGGFSVGMAICFDLRFSQIFRTYFQKGCDIIVIPSNFTYETGKDHWEALLRARAIENQCYIVAPNQCGRDSNKIQAYGNSMVVDPWGRIIARTGEKKEGALLVKIDRRLIREARNRLV